MAMPSADSGLLPATSSSLSEASSLEEEVLVLPARGETGQGSVRHPVSNAGKPAVSVVQALMWSGTACERQCATRAVAASIQLQLMARSKQTPASSATARRATVVPPWRHHSTAVVP